MAPKCYLDTHRVYCKLKLKGKWREILLQLIYKQTFIFLFQFPSKSKFIKGRNLIFSSFFQNSFSEKYGNTKYIHSSVYSLLIYYFVHLDHLETVDKRLQSAPYRYISGSIQRTRCYTIVDTKYILTKLRNIFETNSICTHSL